MKIKEVDWKAVLDVRHQVLWPNKSKEFCIVKGDKTANHYGIYCENELVGVASTYRDKNSVRLRKFAVIEKYQGKGYGSKLLKKIIKLERKNVSDIFWCDARKTAVSFYQQFGMEVEGEVFYKSEEPYVKMLLNLQ